MQAASVTRRQLLPITNHTRLSALGWCRSRHMQRIHAAPHTVSSTPSLLVRGTCRLSAHTACPILGPTGVSRGALSTLPSCLLYVDHTRRGTSLTRPPAEGAAPPHPPRAYMAAMLERPCDLHQPGTVTLSSDAPECLGTCRPGDRAPGSMCRAAGSPRSGHASPSS